MQVVGNDRADALAEEGCNTHIIKNGGHRSHPNQEPRLPLLWEEVGLLPMRSDVSSSAGGGGSIEPPPFQPEQGQVSGAR